MNTITVFKPPEVQEIKSNKTENEIMYEVFEKHASIPKYHFSTFMEMENYEESKKDINSTLPSILIKSILKYCTPIIRTIPEFTVQTKTVDIFKKTDKPVDTRLKDDKYYNISMQLEYPIVCKIDYNKIIDKKLKLDSIVVPKHATFRIIGIIINKKIVKTPDNSFLNHMLELSEIDILKAGNFGIEEFQSETYTQSRLDKQPLLINLKPIYFTSDDDANNKIQIINKYIKYVNNFYQTSTMLYKYTHNKPFSPYIKEQHTLFNIFNAEFYKKENNITKNPILIALAKLIQIRLGSSTYSNDFIFDKYQLFDQLHQIKLLGISHPLSKKKLQDLNIKKSYLAIINDYTKLKFIKMLEYAKKKAISYNKFNICNITELSNAQLKIVNLEFDKMEKFYQSMSENSQDFELVNSLFWAIQNDKPHLIHERLEEIEKLINIPKDFIKELSVQSHDLTKELSMFKNSKKISIICPHVIAKAHYMLKPAQNDLIKGGLLREFLITNFSLPVNDDGYFCKVCGELLAESDDDEILKYISGKRVSFVMEYDNLKSQIWKEVAHIITTYVKFKDAVNHKNIVTSITNTIRPELGTIENNLAKIKSNSKDSIKDLMRIYTVVYIFAIVVNMINKNYGKITFSTRQTSIQNGGYSVPHTSSLMDYNSTESDIYEPKVAESEINESEIAESDVVESEIVESEIVESEINESEVAESDIYEPEILLKEKKKEKKPHKNLEKQKKNTTSKKEKKPHKNLEKKNHKLLIGGKENPKDSQKILQNIINNALFLILRILNLTINNVSSISIESIKPILIKAYKWTTSLQTDTNKSDNKTKHEIQLNNDTIYNYIRYVIKLVAYNNVGNKDLTSKSINISIKDVLGRTVETIESDFKENKSIYATAIIPDSWCDLKISNNECKYKYESFKSLIEYVKNKLYNENAVPYSSALESYDKKYDYVSKLSNEIFYSQKRAELKPYNNIVLHNNFGLKYNNFNPETIKIEKYYDNNGNHHKFDVFVYQKANPSGVLAGPKKEYKKSDILKWLNDKDLKKTDEFTHLFIVDERCSKCNTLLSQTKNTSIEKAIDKKDEINVFFKYFENRCPKGELHDFEITVQKGKESCCAKCGITKSTVNDQDSKYYDKYIKIYEKISLEKIALEKKEVSKIINSTKDVIEKKKFEPWKINNVPILELSRTFKIKYNVWINLGLTINQKYHLIESEKINPSESASPNALILRNIQLHSYYLRVVTLFYIVKNHETVKNMPYDLKQIMLKNSVRDLYKKLIDLDNSILSQYDYYKNTETPSNVSNFLLYSISSTILNIYNSMKKAGMETSHDIIKLIINTIIESEKLLSEPDLVKFTSAIIASNNIDVSLDGVVMADVDGDDIQDGYGSAAESEKSLIELGDDEPDDQFSIGDLDIEIDADENLISNPSGY